MAENPVFDPKKLLGGDLAKYEPAQLLELVKKLCKIAASECGENGFRGGFRPGNIYIADDGRVAVGPAGKAGEEGWTKLELEFMAPEMFWNGEKSAAADVYSIGLIMYSGLNGGRLPFMPDSDEPGAEERVNALRTRMSGSIPPVPEGVDEKLAAILRRALAFDIQKRYENSVQLLKALWDYCGDEPEELPERAQPPLTEPVKEPEPKPKPEPEKKPEPPKKPDEEPKPEPETEQEKPAKPPMNIHQRRSAVVSGVTLAVIALLLTAAGFAGKYIDLSLPEPAAPTPEPTAVVTPEPTPTPTPTPEPTPTPQPEKHYSLYVEDVSWDVAEQKCMTLGGHLATIGSAEEYAAICRLLQDTDAEYVWIGCYRSSDGVLKWAGGESTEYFNWAPGEPSCTDSYDGAAEDYIMLVKQPDGTWLYNDSRMDPMADYSRFYGGKLAYICQMG